MDGGIPPPYIWYFYVIWGDNTKNKVFTKKFWKKFLEILENIPPYINNIIT
jgi:hypothetical protein